MLSAVPRPPLPVTIEANFEVTRASPTVPVVSHDTAIPALLAIAFSNANGFTLSSIISYVINVIEQFHSLTIALGLDSYVSINNALISSYNKGYLLNDEFSEEGLECFCDTQRARVKSDNCIFLYTSIACLNFPSPSQGKQMHGKTIKIESPRNQIPVDNALVSMYVKCGNLKDANMLFEMMHQCNMVSFNTMITPYAHHGFGLEELELFKVILDIENEPTSIIFILVLSTRSHTGKVDEGWKYFDSMRQNYVKPGRSIDIAASFPQQRMPPLLPLELAAPTSPTVSVPDGGIGLAAEDHI
ncbi:hypothetical protein ZIOFF_009674 [Zingiber officinale]|uniref:Pentatricopeptide repeat-containing protein n=1 Tax=Zingiber officinale TaxID=94328 RepID=A0A8J5HI30_ZINOF|nr:hypothetical protein ZIOFF_009674 [Zingiber officinale]